MIFRILLYLIMLPVKLLISLGPYVWLIIAMIIYFITPLVGKIVFLILNLFIADPIPYIDEILMIIGLLHNLVVNGELIEWIYNNIKLILGVLIVIGIIVYMIWFR